MEASRSNKSLSSPRACVACALAHAHAHAHAHTHRLVSHKKTRWWWTLLSMEQASGCRTGSQSPFDLAAGVFALAKPDPADSSVPGRDVKRNGWGQDKEARPRSGRVLSSSSPRRLPIRRCRYHTSTDGAVPGGPARCVWPFASGRGPLKSNPPMETIERTPFWDEHSGWNENSFQKIESDSQKMESVSKKRQFSFCRLEWQCVALVSCALRKWPLDWIGQCRAPRILLRLMLLVLVTICGRSIINSDLHPLDLRFFDFRPPR